MSTRRRWVRVLRATALTAFALLAALFAFVQIQQHLLRWRAERLLADIRQIQMGKSTWADAQVFMTKWGRWGTYTGSCTPEKCMDWIQIQDDVWYLRSACGESCGFLRRVERPYGWLGGRTAMAEAQLEVANKKITTAGFSLFIEVPAGHSREWPAEHGLVGHATEYAAPLDPYNFRGQRLLHPEYWIGKPGGCEGCVKLDTTFTPFVSQEKLLRLTGFDLTCITRWSPCANEGDLMPSAWNEYEAELAGDDDREKAFETCEVPLEFFGREYQDIAIAEILASETLREPNHVESIAKIRIIRSLKGQTHLSPEKAAYFTVFDRGRGVAGWSSTDLTAGEKYILMGGFGEWSGGGKLLALDDCGVVPFSDQNLAAIQRGINASLERMRPRAMQRQTLP